MSTYPDHIVVNAASHPNPVRDKDCRVQCEVDEQVQLDPGLGVAVELRREEEDPREDADGGREVEGAPLREAPERFHDERDVGAEQSDDHAQVILLQPPVDTKFIKCIKCHVSFFYCKNPQNNALKAL